MQVVADAAVIPIASESVHMVLTSPPYDGIRNYVGRPVVDVPALGSEIARVLVPGGVAAVVLQDQTKNGWKSLTTFRTAVAWCDGTGLGLFECLVWERPGVPGAWWNRRFRVDHEYVLLFVRGRRPRYFDKSHVMVPSIHGGTDVHGYTIKPRKVDTGSKQLTNGKRAPYTNSGRLVAPTKCPGTVFHWQPTKCEPRDADRNLKRKHPATFPQALVSDMVQCFTQPGDIVLDPFSGSGSTLVEARKLSRKAIGLDVAMEYCRIAKERLR